MRKMLILFLFLLLFVTPAFGEELFVEEILEEMYMEEYFEPMYAEGMVLVDGYLNVREKPFSDAKMVGKRFHGDMVFITGKCNGYYKINDGQYISEEYVYITERYSATGVFIPENMKYLRIKYLGRIDTKVSASSVITGISLRFVGEIPVYEVVDGYAYFPRGKNDIFKLPVEAFAELTPVGEYHEILTAYRTTYKSSSDRGHNIELAASYFDGMVINPGKTFSFNGVTGPRSASKGYRMASAYLGEEVIQAYGGGVCQLSSTIYSAVRQCTGIAITERRPHSMRVSYLPEELEATVNYNNVDFKFINEYDFPVKLSITAEEDVLLVILLKM